MLLFIMPPWRNWQTRRIQNPVLNGVSVRSRPVVSIKTSLIMIMGEVFLMYSQTVINNTDLTLFISEIEKTATNKRISAPFITAN